MTKQTVVDIEIPIKCSTAKGIINKTGCALDTAFGWMQIFDPVVQILVKVIAWSFYYAGMALDLLFPMFFFAFLLAGSASLVVTPEHYAGSTDFFTTAFVRVMGLLGVGMFSAMIIAWATMRYKVDLKIHCIKDKVKE